MIYVHVPFCKSFCRYCSFYSEIACGDRAFDGFIREVCDEAVSRRAEIGRTLGTNTLYIGGGTPSVMPLRFFERLLEALPFEPFDEFTVEVNPDDVVGRGEEFAGALRSLGVNRISMGVQSLDGGLLRWMGRRHSAPAALEAFRILRTAGFDNISVDVIFGVGGMTLEMLGDTLDGILALGPEHISAYQLSIEDGSQLAEDVEAGRYTEASDEECAAQYGLICSRLHDAGYRHYEISNWARPGREAVHNGAYWTRRPYVGLGPGAHSLEGSDIRSWNSQELSGWTRSFETLTPEEIREERIMLGLRTDEGLDPSELFMTGPLSGGHSDTLPDEALSQGPAKSVDLPDGLVTEGGRIRIPEDKWFVADSIIAGLV